MIHEFGLIPTRSKAVSVGDKYGTLTVLVVGSEPTKNRIKAICKCNCGKIVCIRVDSMKAGVVVSCGCHHLAVVTTHGMTNSVHFGRWAHMMSRCNNPKDAAYKNYGGRGIKVCLHWHDVATFIAELPEGYWDGAQLDRIDNDKGYEPGNIRWSTPKGNAANRRGARLYTLSGVTKSQREWAKAIGVADQAIQDRIDNLGWSVEKALTTPLLDTISVAKNALAIRWAGHKTKGKPSPKTARRRLVVQHNGREVTMAQLSSECGVSAKNLRRRIFELRWPVSRAILNQPKPFGPF
ncbi:MAG: hypothetical protein ACRDAM_17195 [Casimicrobium sp.]